MRNRKIILIFSLILIIFFLSYAIVLAGKGKKNNSDFYSVAACPTFYKILETLEIENKNIKTIKTRSSTESLILLKNNRVDYVISGRALKPGELFNYRTIGKNNNYYSFLGKDELTIYYSDLNNYTFYTDLDLKKTREELKIKNIVKTDNIYEHLEDGIIITSWNNTDLNLAKIITILNKDGSKLAKSRIPIIYFNNKEKEIKNIKEIIQKNYEKN